MIQAPWNRLGLRKELAMEFLGVFARFEYALKAAGFVTGKQERAEPDWGRFAAAVSGVFDRNATPELAQAAAYLLQNPPNKQVLQGGRLAWLPPQFGSNSSEIERLLGCVRIVRNNLFHGGKFFPQSHDASRDSRLVEASMVVLDACLPLEPSVGQEFSR